MRVLLVTDTFAGPNSQPWLLDDLARALAEAGHYVDVIIRDPKHGRTRGEKPGDHPHITTFSVGTVVERRTGLQKLFSYLNIGFGLHTKGFSWVKKRRYDLCITTSIAAFDWGFPGRVKKRMLARHNILFLWDFFPIHQLQIGRIRANWLAPIMKAIERRAINTADTVALMSPANLHFFLTYHRNASNNTVIIPPWSSLKVVEVNTSQELPLLVLFGGQIARGRGLDTLLDAAEILLSDQDEIKIMIAGDGPERASLQQNSIKRNLTNVHFLGALPRGEYRDLARSTHVGVAVTVVGVSSPSFPSKIVEYCSLGLPVIVCVEDSSDAGDLVVEHGAGFSVPAGDADALASAMKLCLEKLKSNELRQVSDAALSYFESSLSVDRVVDSLEKLAFRS